MKTEDVTYYKQTIPKLIEKHKAVIEQCLKIMGQTIMSDLSDDKMHNVIKSKRMAAETAEWSSKEIDRLTEENNLDPSKTKKATSNYSEKFAN